VAGFDLLYSLQDLDFDRERGLNSLPVKLGAKKTLLLATALHGLFLGALVAYGLFQDLGWIYWLGLVLSGVFLLWQHRIIQEGMHRINAAFFTANGLLSLFFLVFVALDLYL
jgi:4-hydroxybenzoate polyprenyltransferase